MTKIRYLTAVVLGVALMGMAASVEAEGIVQSASKDAVKGAVKGVAQEINNSGNLVNGAKQVTKGVVDGVSDAVPQMTSQAINQANVNKKTMGKVARTVTSQAVAGAVNAGVEGITNAIGEDGDGKLADAMAANTERIAAALVRGVKSQMDFHVNVNPWLLLLGFALGGFSTLFCAAGMLLLYIAFQRRRTPVVVENMTPMRSPRPATSIS